MSVYLSSIWLSQIWYGRLETMNEEGHYDQSGELEANFGSWFCRMTWNIDNTTSQRAIEKAGTWAKEYIRLVLSDLGPDQTLITSTSDTPFPSLSSFMILQTTPLSITPTATRTPALTLSTISDHFWCSNDSEMQRFFFLWWCDRVKNTSSKQPTSKSGRAWHCLSWVVPYWTLLFPRLHSDTRQLGSTSMMWIKKSVRPRHLFQLKKDGNGNKISSSWFLMMRSRAQNRGAAAPPDRRQSGDSGRLEAGLSSQDPTKIKRGGLGAGLGGVFTGLRDSRHVASSSPSMGGPFLKEIRVLKLTL